MTADVIDLHDAAYRGQTEDHLKLFEAMPVGGRCIYHTGAYAPTGPLAAAARQADARNIGLLFQRRVSSGGDYGVGQFEYIFVRCSRATALALRHT